MVFLQSIMTKSGKYYLLLLATFCAISVQAQMIKATVVSAFNGDSLPYVGVNISGKLHAISDSKGRFSINPNKKWWKDSISFYAPGFEKYTTCVNDLAAKLLFGDSIIALSLIPHKLAEVEVSDKKSLKERKEGFKRRHGNAMAGFSFNSAGSELASLVAVKHVPALLRSLKIFIVENNYPKLNLRISVYEADEEGKISNRLLSNAQIIQIEKEQKELTIQFQDQVYIKSNCYVSIELLNNLDTEGLFFDAVFSNKKNNIYFRKNKADKWQVLKGTLLINLFTLVLPKAKWKILN